MIRSDKEYQQTLNNIENEERHLREQKEELLKLDFSSEEIRRVLEPRLSFQEQLREEATSYEKLKRGEFEEVSNFEGMGRLLIALRISKGFSQRELAEQLGVHESQVSRDEKNEYYGVSIERVRRLLDVLGVEVKTSVVAIQNLGGAGVPTRVP